MSALNRTATIMNTSAISTNDCLFDDSGVFNPEILRTGNQEDQQRELYNWMLGEGSSVFIKWVPDELVDDHIARQYFGHYGQVDRIDFVPKVNEHGKKSGHMAFVHFHRFNTENSFSNDVASSYPEPFETDFRAINRNNNAKVFKLKCCVNTRPIPKVLEFNASQITDMIQNMNLRIAAETAERLRDKEEIRNLKDQLAAVLQRLDTLEIPSVIAATDALVDSVAELCSEMQ